MSVVPRYEYIKTDGGHLLLSCTHPAGISYYDQPDGA